MFSKRNIIAVLILVAAGGIAYFNTLPGVFIHDDESEIVDNPYIRSGRYVGKILTSPAWAFEYSDERAGISNYYRPLQYLIYMGIYRVCGLNPAGYHLFKLILHIVTAILLFFLLEGYFANFRTALAAAILFSVHPIHTEAVTWISGITDALVTPFVLIALLLYLRAVSEASGSPSRHPWVCYVASLAFFFVGLFSKETAVILIPLMILHDLLFERRSLHLKRIAAYLPYVILFIVYLGFRINAIGSLKVAGCKYEYLNRWQCLLNPVCLTASYFFKALLPIDQNGWYVFHPVLRFWDARFILSL
ncbi:MAG: glycosyltransferase family 39 protein, partial [bacterium]